jgi:hypothetical protein
MFSTIRLQDELQYGNTKCYHYCKSLILDWFSWFNCLFVWGIIWIGLGGWTLISMIPILKWSRVYTRNK